MVDIVMDIGIFIRVDREKKIESEKNISLSIYYAIILKFASIPCVEGRITHGRTP